MSTVVDAIAAKIRSIESVRPELNNPGALMDLPYYQETGEFRLAQYPSLDAGEAALRAQIERNIGKGLTFYEFFGGKPGVYGGYAPAGHGDNDPVAYAEAVAAAVGASPDQVIADVMGGGGDTGGGPETGTVDSETLMYIALGALVLGVVWYLA